VDAVLAGHQRRAAGGADRAGGVPAREDRALLGKPIQVRRLPLLSAVEADVRPAQVIGKEEDKVGLVGGRGWSGESEESGEGECQSHARASWRGGDVAD